MKDICKLEGVADIIADVEYVSKWFTNKKWKGINLRRKLLKQHSKAQLGKHLKCKKACDTRFASLCMLGDRLRRLRPALRAVVVDATWENAPFQQEIEDDLSPKILSETWWEQLNDLLNLLSPVRVMLRVLDSNKPTISKVYNLMFNLGNRLRELTVPWKDEAIKCFDERWIYLHSPLHAAGYALDPEFLDTLGTDSSEIQEGLFTTFDRIALLEVAKRDNIRVGDVGPDDERVVQFVATCEQQFDGFKDQHHPIFKRKSVITNRKEMPAHKWWKNYCNHLPELQAVATRVLSQVGAASICERNWSVHGMVHSKGRYSLQPARSEKLVFNHQSLRLLDQLNDPLYKEEPLAWDMLGGSDSSDPDANSEDTP